MSRVNGMSPINGSALRAKVRAGYVFEGDQKAGFVIASGNGWAWGTLTLEENADGFSYDKRTAVKECVLAWKAGKAEAATSE